MPGVNVVEVVEVVEPFLKDFWTGVGAAATGKAAFWSLRVDDDDDDDDDGPVRDPRWWLGSIIRRLVCDSDRWPTSAKDQALIIHSTCYLLSVRSLAVLFISIFYVVYTHPSSSMGKRMDSSGFWS